MYGYTQMRSVFASSLLEVTKTGCPSTDVDFVAADMIYATLSLKYTKNYKNRKLALLLVKCPPG